jgi:hypothetical protein
MSIPTVGSTTALILRAGVFLLSVFFFTFCAGIAGTFCFDFFGPTEGAGITGDGVVSSSDSDEEQDSHDGGGDEDSDDKDYPEPFDAGRVIPPSGPLKPAGALSCSGKFSEFNAPGGGQDGIVRA